VAALLSPVFGTSLLLQLPDHPMEKMKLGFLRESHLSLELEQYLLLPEALLNKSP